MLFIKGDNGLIGRLCVVAQQDQEGVPLNGTAKLEPEDRVLGGFLEDDGLEPDSRPNLTLDLQDGCGLASLFSRQRVQEMGGRGIKLQPALVSPRK